MVTGDEIIEKLAVMLSPRRWHHSLGVQATAGQLAERFGADVGQARLAGLVHDCAKGLGGQELLGLAKSFGLSVDAIELAEPDLLHGPVGACLCETLFGITDPEVLAAVRVHTTGDAGMTLLQKIIYLADYIEPGRDFPGVGRLRELAERNLNLAVVQAASQTIRFVTERGRTLHPRTLAARDELVREIARKGVGSND